VKQQLTRTGLQGGDAPSCGGQSIQRVLRPSPIAGRIVAAVQPAEITGAQCGKTLSPSFRLVVRIVDRETIPSAAEQVEGAVREAHQIPLQLMHAGQIQTWKQ
jgi:hypothetical protein